MQKSFDRAEYVREFKFISDAVINLYASHINSLLYNYDNPLISDSLRNAFQCLQKAFRKINNIHLEMSAGKVMVEGDVLEGDVLVLNNFASWLNSMDIKSLSFVDGLTRRELISFHKIISMKRLTAEELFKTMSEKGITNISVHLAEFPDAVPPDAVSLNDTADQEISKNYVSTMFHVESGQEKAPFFNPDTSSLVGEKTEKDHNARFDEKSFEFEISDLVTEKTEEDRYTLCVEMLLEREISDDERRAIRGIPPEHMADLLNAMLLVTPSEDVLTRIAAAYLGIDGDASAGYAADRQKIFFERLKTELRHPLRIICSFLFNTDDQYADQEPAGISNAPWQEIPSPSIAGSDENGVSGSSPPVLQRTLENSDFVFDFIVDKKAVLHDIDIEGDSASLFNESHLTDLQQGVSPDELLSRLNTMDNNARSVAILECTDEVILGMSFDVILDLVVSDCLESDVYQKLAGKLTSLVEFFLLKGEFEKVLDVFNALKTQSLQGSQGFHATLMIRNIFSTDSFNSKIVEALKLHGRKQRESAGRLTSVLGAYLVPYLLDALNEESDTSKRKFMITLLTSVRSDVLSYIVKRLSDSRWYVLRNMLYLLRECHGQSYAPEVKNFLEHEVPLVRLEALKTLLSFQDPDAELYVRKFLKSDIFQLQKGAVCLAGAHRIRTAVPHLLILLKGKDILGKKILFKKGIIRVLGRIGDGRAVGQLMNMCRSTSVIHKNDFDKLKIEIFRTLHNYPVAKIGPLLDYGLRSTNKDIVTICQKLIKRYKLPLGNRGKV